MAALSPRAPAPGTPAATTPGSGGGGPAVPSAQFQPILSEYTLISEMKLLQQQKLKGVYMQMGSQTVWDGTIFLRSGFYASGVFRFKILLPEDYPGATVPRLYFQSSIFHPQVNPLTGELNVTKYIPTWDPVKCRMWHVVKTARKIFYNIDAEDAVNAEAGLLYAKDVDAFEAKAAEGIPRASKEFSAVACSSMRFDSDTDTSMAMRQMKAFITPGLDAERRKKVLNSGRKSTATLVGAGSHGSLREQVKTAGVVHTDSKKLRLSDTACRGWLSKLGSDSNWIRRWCVLDVPADGADEAKRQSTAPGAAVPFDEHSMQWRAATFTEFENEQERVQQEQLAIGDVLHAYQPATQEMIANNTFLIVFPESTQEFRAASDAEVRLWLSVIRICNAEGYRSVSGK